MPLYSPSGAILSNATPQPLGAVYSGAALLAARDDHVHADQMTKLGLYGLTGSAGGYRLVGTVNGAAPTSGTFAVSDIMLDLTFGGYWVCVTAGTPGTWRARGLSATGSFTATDDAAIRTVTYVHAFPAIPTVMLTATAITNNTPVICSPTALGTGSFNYFCKLSTNTTSTGTVTGYYLATLNQP